MHLRNVLESDFHVDSKTTEATTLGTIKVGSPAESEDSITPLPPWTGPRSLTGITKSLKTSRIYLALSTRMPSIRRPSADNSKS